MYSQTRGWTGYGRDSNTEPVHVIRTRGWTFVVSLENNKVEDNVAIYTFRANKLEIDQTNSLYYSILNSLFLLLLSENFTSNGKWKLVCGRAGQRKEEAEEEENF